MTRSRTYLTPAVLDDVRIGTPEKILEFRSHPAWRKVSVSKARRSDNPPDRHDFRAKVMNHCKPSLSPADVPVPSSVRAVVTALSSGRNNHAEYLGDADLKDVCLKLYAQASRNTPPAQAIRTADVILAAVELGAATSIYRIMSYDQLICALDRVGPVIFTFPWYERFISSDELALSTGRAEKPWGEQLGLTTVCVSGYSANGMLATIEHCQPGWRSTSFQISEEHLVQLAVVGEIYVFDRSPRGETHPALYS